MIIQNGIHKELVHKRYVLGAHPILQHFMDQLKIPEIMSTYLPKDQRTILSTDKTLTIVLHNILTHPMPLYEIAQWIKPLDESRISLEPKESLLINDDRVAKALDFFYKSRHQDIFFRLALRAIKIFKINCQQMHQDTTTITFAGRYDNWRAQPALAYGINKDHRPDLKQLVLGLSVTADGSVPLSHQIYAGNQTDDRLHPDNHQRLRQLLERSDFIYVADCKLATDDNLTKIDLCGGLFVTVMPRTWKEDEQFRQDARQNKIRWTHLLSKADNRKPDSKRNHYYLAGGTYATKQGYRLIWIKSSEKTRQDKQTRERHMQKALEELKAIQTRLNTYSLKKRKNIKNRITSVLQEHQCVNFIDYHITKKSYTKNSYLKPGRPHENAPQRTVSKKYYTVSFAPNRPRLAQEKLTDGVFPLLTNLKDHSPKKILETYKYQPFLEKRHSQLKTYQEIAPVFLKKSERVIAYLHMQVMALMVATLIERQLRLAMKRQAIDSLPIYPEDKDCRYPTTFDIVRLFNNVERYEVQENDRAFIFPAQLNKIQKQVLELLEVPIALYQ
jgi:transposase